MRNSSVTIINCVLALTVGVLFSRTGCKGEFELRYSQAQWNIKKDYNQQYCQLSSCPFLY